MISKATKKGKSSVSYDVYYEDGISFYTQPFIKFENSLKKKGYTLCYMRKTERSGDIDWPAEKICYIEIGWGE